MVGSTFSGAVEGSSSDGRVAGAGSATVRSEGLQEVNASSFSSAVRFRWAYLAPGQTRWPIAEDTGGNSLAKSARRGVPWRKAD